jgi:glycerate 2-kinase
MQAPLAEARSLLRSIFLEALESVRGERLIEALGGPDGGCWRIRRNGLSIDFPLPVDGRLVVVGAGKAVGSLAKGLEAVLGDRIDDGCIIVKHGHRETLSRIRQLEAGHPIPDMAGVRATEELLRTVDGLTERDRVIVLLTGGASALMVAPVEGVTLQEKAVATDMLLRSGASIEEINWVRKRLSRVKGGRLLDRMGQASVLTLLISDVPSGDDSMIGSGPTIRPRSDERAPDIFARYGLADHAPASVLHRLAQEDPASAARHDPRREAALLLADSGTLVRAVHDVAARKGLAVADFDTRMTGNTHEAARAMAAALRETPHGVRPRLLVSAGETTLQVTGHGKGGRNQEFALVASLAMEGAADVALLAAGTDGTDGPTDAAGAFADGLLGARAAAAGYDPAEALARNDSYALFERTGDLFRTGPTGTNVMDLVLGLAF